MPGIAHETQVSRIVNAEGASTMRFHKNLSKFLWKLGYHAVRPGECGPNWWLGRRGAVQHVCRGNRTACGLPADRLVDLIDIEAEDTEPYHPRLHHCGKCSQWEHIGENFELYSLRPDAYRLGAFEENFDPQRPPYLWHEVTVWEVEDGHKVPDWKLRKYTDLWFELDSICVAFSLILVDRYGRSTPFDLVTAWYASH